MYAVTTCDTQCLEYYGPRRPALSSSPSASPADGIGPRDTSLGCGRRPRPPAPTRLEERDCPSSSFRTCACPPTHDSPDTAPPNSRDAPHWESVPSPPLSPRLSSGRLARLRPG